MKCAKNAHIFSEPGVGLQLLLDGQSTRKLTGVELRDYIRACVEAIGMTILFGPVVHRIGTGRQAHAIIAEADLDTSHIMVKALADKRVFIDIFSCRPFDTVVPMRLAEHILGIHLMQSQEIQRAGTAGP